MSARERCLWTRDLIDLTDSRQWSVPQVGSISLCHCALRRWELVILVSRRMGHQRPRLTVQKVRSYQLQLLLLAISINECLL